MAMTDKQAGVSEGMPKVCSSWTSSLPGQDFFLQPPADGQVRWIFIRVLFEGASVMLNRWLRCTVCIAILAACGAGCSTQNERLNAPPQGDTSRRSDLQANYVYMTDKAILMDSSITDIHFEPHVADLSGLGVRHLTRLAELLSECGGVVRYDTESRDAELVAARLEAARGFLASAGFDTEKTQLREAMAGSSGMTAAEAIIIKNSREGAGGGAAEGSTAAAPTSSM